MVAKYSSRNLPRLREERTVLESKLTNRQVKLLESIRNFDISPTVQFMREEFGSDYFANITLDAQHKRMVGSYNEIPTSWRSAANITTVNDFKLQRAIAASGFTDLPTVMENGEYEMERIEDEARGTYSVVKRGMLFGLTLEAQANDELGAFSERSAKFGAAAARTLDKFVMNTNLALNPTIYDGVALIDAAHNNLVSGVLAEGTLQTAIESMRNQTGIKSAEAIQIDPFTLCVNPTEEWTARKLLESTNLITGTGSETPSKNVMMGTVANLVVSSRITTLKPILLANPAQVDMFELGFYQGMQSPEMFTEDPGAASEFERDVNRWKVRHIFGGVWRDYRGVVGINY